MHLEIKIKKTKKDYYKLTLISEDNKFIGEFERSEIRNIIGVLDNEI
jgi:hypothetical protein